MRSFMRRGSIADRKHKVVQCERSRSDSVIASRAGAGVDYLDELQARADLSSQPSRAAQLQALADRGTAGPARQSPGRPNQTGLPDRLKRGIEQLSGLSIDDVRVHYGSSRPARVGALAYTQGTDIHVAPGQEQHVPHEAWHAVQQKQGRVQATTRAGGVPVNDDTRLEREADEMGARALQCRLGDALPRVIARPSTGASSPIQRVLTRAAAAQHIEQLTAFILAKKTLDPSAIFRGYQFSYDVSKLTKQDLEALIAEALAQLQSHHGEKDEVNAQDHPDQADAPEIQLSQEQAKQGLVGAAAEYWLSLNTMQMRRNPNQVSAAKTFPTINVGNYVNVSYKTDGKGGIDFTKPHSVVTWKDPVDSGSLVDLSKDVKGGKYGMTKNGSLVDIKNASRSQHFSIANRIMGNPESGSSPAGWTWHHLLTYPKMVLVDRKVHSKYGHNGGVLLW